MNSDLLCDVIYNMDIEKLRELLAIHVMGWHKEAGRPNLWVRKSNILLPEKQWLPDKNIAQAMALIDAHTEDLAFQLERDWDGRWYSMLMAKNWSADERLMVVASSGKKEKAICYVVILSLIAQLGGPREKAAESDVKVLDELR